MDDDRYDKTDEVVVARSSDSDDDILVIESPKGDKTQCPERSEGKSSAPCVIEETTAAPTTSNKISRESDDKILQTIRSSSSLFIDGNNPFYDYGSDPLGSFNGYHPWSDLRQPEPELDNKTNTSDSTSGSQGRKRSLSSDCTSISSVPHKKRYATAPMSDLQSMETVVGECLICLVCVDNANLFKCIQGHPCCGDCLQKSAKRTLEHKREGRVKCTVWSCDSFFSTDVLRRGLAAVVVNKLVERGQTEAMNRAVAFDNSGSFCLPVHWEEMNPDEPGYKAVVVKGGSKEYRTIASLFLKTMISTLECIKRVQNTILWQYYSVKRKQMTIANNGRRVLELWLFHGTNFDLVDAICRNGFDWRECGTNGTLYGQGTYFARDASYSHKHKKHVAMRQQPSGSSLSVFRNMRALQQQLAGHSGERPQQLLLLRAPHQKLLLLQRKKQKQQGSTSGLQMGASTPQAAVSPNSSGDAAAQSGAVPHDTSSSSGTVASSSSGDDSKKTHAMIVSRVLVGCYTKGNPTFRKPPPTDPTKPLGKAFDSCVDNVEDPHIYVAFESAQCYPEYIIEYH